jgi:preprotein translocase subunit SecD
MGITRGCIRGAVAVAGLLSVLGCRASAPAPPVSDPWEKAPELRPQEVHAPPGHTRSSLQLRPVLEQPAAGSQQLAAPDGASLIVSSEAILTERDITKAEVTPDTYPGSPYATISIHFTPEAAERLREFSRSHMGQRLAFVLDGVILMAPAIMSQVDSPVLISGTFSPEEAARTAQQLAPR